MAGMVLPQADDQADKPVYRAAPASAHLTNAASSTTPVEAAASADPGWAARLALNAKLNPPAGPAPLSQSMQELFSRELPASGAPTPSFTPRASDLLANHKVALADGVFGGPPALPAASATAAPITLAARHQLHGTPEHAMSNPNQYDAAAWQKAFSGMPSDTFFKMMGLAHQRTVQDQAAGLALSMALHRQENVEPFLRALSGANPMSLSMPVPPASTE